MLQWFSKRLNELHEKNRDERGFTLIELLVVIIIIGILAAIAIPVFLGQRDRAQDARAVSDVRNGATAMEAFYTDNETYTGADVTALEAIEPSINWTATVAAAGDVAPSGLSDTGYTLTTESESGTTITLVKTEDGTTITP